MNKFITADFPPELLAEAEAQAPGVPMRRILRGALILAVVRPDIMSQVLRLAALGPAKLPAAIEAIRASGGAIQTPRGLAPAPGPVPELQLAPALPPAPDREPYTGPTVRAVRRNLSAVPEPEPVLSPEEALAPVQGLPETLLVRKCDDTGRFYLEDIAYNLGFETDDLGDVVDDVIFNSDNDRLITLQGVKQIQAYVKALSPAIAVPRLTRLVEIIR